MFTSILSILVSSLMKDFSQATFCTKHQQVTGEPTHAKLEKLQIIQSPAQQGVQYTHTATERHLNTRKETN